MQSAPQAIPTGDDVTVPDPDPDLNTDNVNVFNVNVAVTFLAAVIDTTHDPVPEHPSPDQPVNVDPVAAAAVNVTEVP